MQDGTCKGMEGFTTMSYAEERMLILKMLEEGKISSEEAARLLEALESGQKQTSGQGTARQEKQSNYQASFQEEIRKTREKINEWRKDIRNNYNQKDFDRLVDEFSSKAEKLGKNLANTTFGIVDKLVEFVGSFVDTNAFNIFGNYPVAERKFEALASEGMDLDIEGINGPVFVKKHLENSIIIKTRVKSPQNNADDVLVFSDNGKAISLKLNNTGNISVTHEVFLPAVKYGNVRLVTSNAKVYVEDTLAGNFETITKNGNVELMGVNSDRIKVENKNAKIQVSYVLGKNIDINAINSIVDIKHIKTENVSVTTTNGRIQAENIQNFEDVAEINMRLKTTNGGIKVNMNDMDNRGYKIKAQTRNGGINLLIPEITYHNINKRGPVGSFVEAESKGYDSCPGKVDIIAETESGYIEIVK